MPRSHGLNLNNSLRRVPLVGPLLNALLGGTDRKRGAKVGLNVCANAVTAYAGPYSVTYWPGGRGVDRYEVMQRGPGDWYRSLSRTVRGFHFQVSLDRNPRWRRQYR